MAVEHSSAKDRDDITQIQCHSCEGENGVGGMGLARSRRPGRTLTKVVNQIARKGVRVFFEFLPKKPPSGRPISENVRINFV